MIRIAIAMAALTLAGWGQVSEGIRGSVTDPAGKVVPGVAVTIFDEAQKRVGQSTTNAEGFYEVRRLTAGKYTVRVTAKGFAPFAADMDGSGVLDIRLTIAKASERITVNESAGLDVSAENNEAALVLKGKDLEALSDNRDDITADLLALAGPSAGPDGAQIYIDGFTGGRMPPKASIREIRINQNPFSAQFDRLGQGRIEVFTKPGTEDYHGLLVS